MTDVSLITTNVTGALDDAIAAVRCTMVSLADAALELARRHGGIAANVSFSVAATEHHEPFNVAVDVILDTSTCGLVKMPIDVAAAALEVDLG